MQLISLEELEMLMVVAGSVDPVQTALQMRRRWTYILAVARAASHGVIQDSSIPDLIQSCDQYMERAERLITVLDEWLEAHRGEALWDRA